MVPIWQRAMLTPVPSRVTYGFDTSWWFGPLVDNGAYWLQGLQPASGTQGTASAEALTLARTITTLDEVTSSGGSPTDRSAYLLRDSTRRAIGQRPLSNALTLGLTNVSSASADLSQLAVDTSRRYCVDITADAPATVTLTGLAFDGLAVDGVPTTRSSAGLAVHAPTGTSHLVLAPPGTPTLVGSPCPAAATGDGPYPNVPETPLLPLLPLLALTVPASLRLRQRTSTPRH